MKKLLFLGLLSLLLVSCSNNKSETYDDDEEYVSENAGKASGVDGLTEDRITELAFKGPQRFDNDFDRDAFSIDFAITVTNIIEEDIRQNDLESAEGYVYDGYTEFWDEGQDGGGYVLDSYKIISQDDNEAIVFLHGISEWDDTQDHTMYLIKENGQWVINGWDNLKPF